MTSSGLAAMLLLSSAELAAVTPGYQLLVKKDNKIIHNISSGFSDLSAKTKISSETRFRLASNTKPFTGTAVLILEQDGLLNPEESITKYIPELPEEFEPVKVKHLIHHTSGLPPYEHICDDSADIVTNKDIINWLLFEKPDFKPGSRFEYSNTGYVVLASIIERISGTSFASFVEERIFKPLGIEEAFFFDPKTEKTFTDRAHGYPKERNSCNYTYGDDGIFISIDDYNKWTSALNTNIILDEKYRKKLFITGFTDNDEAVSYSYGWEISETQHGLLLSHTGSWMGFRSFVKYYPEIEVWIVLLSNMADIDAAGIMNDTSKEFL